MTTIATLLLAHLIGDFPLQTNKIFKWKNQNNLGLAIHVAIHLGVAAVLMQHPLQYWPVLAVLGIAHFVTDWAKLRFPSQNQAAGFVWDQLIHYATILLLSAWVSDIPAVLPSVVMRIAVALTFIPAIMTFFWVWANQVQQSKKGAKGICVNWASRSLLPMSQWVGKIIVGFLLVSCGPMLLF